MSAKEERKTHISATKSMVPRHSLHSANRRSRGMQCPRVRSERDIVVGEVAATGGLAGGRRAARRLVADPVAAARAAAATQHLHLVHHDLGDVMLLPFLLVVAGTQPAFDVDLLALAHVLAHDLRQAV